MSEKDEIWRSLRAAKANLVRYLIGVYEKILDEEDEKKRDKLVEEFVKTVAEFHVSPVDLAKAEINGLLCDLSDEGYKIFLLFRR